MNSPVHVIAIDREGETKEGSACCSRCARKILSHDNSIVWWEVFDMMGNMVDSADKATEDQEGSCGQ